ncbi:MAG: hypothetical protein DDT30_02118 [Dehalococcoidia bacterium]|nr:hypothetical protein [Bacillota bacterium]MBT9144154.1 hypothetical protein [Bacillota bacterium]MBT9166674.1 hypothetical protein [Chloroflexota bacterium]
MRDHTKLRAFELADGVVLLIYRVTREFPTLAAFSLQPQCLDGLTSQMRRAAASKP